MLKSVRTAARPDEHDSCLREAYSLKDILFIIVLFRHGCAYELPKDIVKMLGI